MIDLHDWPTPNGWKISIMLEECGLPYVLDDEARKALFGQTARTLRDAVHKTR